MLVIYNESVCRDTLLASWLVSQLVGRSVIISYWSVVVITFLTIITFDSAIHAIV